jgi:hypothetical protein
MIIIFINVVQSTAVKRGVEHEDKVTSLKFLNLGRSRT